MSYPHESKYKKEDNWGEKKGCGNSDYKGNKASSRPVTFCDSVTCLSSLSVNGPTTLNSTSVLPPAITVGGVTYVPTTLRYISAVSGGNGSPVIPVYSTIQVLAAQVSG